MGGCEVHIHHHPPPPPPADQRLEEALLLLRQLHHKVNRIMAQIDQLETNVAAIETVQGSVKTLLEELAAEVRAARGDDVRTDAVIARMENSAAALAAAVVENTVAAGGNDTIVDPGNDTIVPDPTDTLLGGNDTLTP